MLLPILMLVLTIGQTKSVDRPPRVVTEKEAKALLNAALPSYAHRLPGLGFEPCNDSGRFCNITVTWAAPAKSSVVVGNYAVDLSTGDVWSAVVSCSELNTPNLRRLQRQVHRRLGLTQSEYRRIKSHGPLCDQ